MRTDKRSLLRCNLPPCLSKGEKTVDLGAGSYLFFVYETIREKRGLKVKMRGGSVRYGWIQSASVTVRVLRDETEPGDGKDNRGEKEVRASVRRSSGRKELFVFGPALNQNVNWPRQRTAG